MITIVEKLQTLNKMREITKKLQTKDWWENVEKLIFPPVCGICGKLNENYLCNRCNLQLQKISEFQIDNYITETGFERKNFNNHIYFFQYQGLIREQIINYKFKDKPYKYKAISKFIINNYILINSKILQNFKDYDVIIPVPLSQKRMMERGYNQAGLIAKEIAKTLEKEIITDCLYKSKNVVAQSTLNKEDREENIKGVYRLSKKEKLANKKILLIDDIYTTGSTANECCKVLKEAEIIKVDVMTIAKD